MTVLGLRDFLATTLYLLEVLFATGGFIRGMDFWCLLVYLTQLAVGFWQIHDFGRAFARHDRSATIRMVVAVISMQHGKKKIALRRTLAIR